jgi:hypothetical protein
MSYLGRLRGKFRAENVPLPDLSGLSDWTKTRNNFQRRDPTPVTAELPEEYVAPS